MIQNSKLLLGPPGLGKTYRLIQEIEAALDSGLIPLVLELSLLQERPSRK